MSFSVGDEGILRLRFFSSTPPLPSSIESVDISETHTQ
jgi:hypothetical protein